jgi:di/tripeptidase
MNARPSAPTERIKVVLAGKPAYLPNIFTGATDFHGPDKHISVQTMEKAMMTIVNICKKG